MVTQRPTDRTGSCYSSCSAAVEPQSTVVAVLWPQAYQIMQFYDYKFISLNKIAQ